jgi:hypothetical protein
MYVVLNKAPRLLQQLKSRWLLSQVQSVLVVFWFEEMKSATQVQKKIHTQYRKKPSSRPTIYSWHKNFVETGYSVLHSKSAGRPCVSDATMEQVRESVFRALSKEQVYGPFFLMKKPLSVSYIWTCSSSSSFHS